MPSIIPTVTPPSGGPTVTTVASVDVNTIIAAGTVLYLTAESRLLVNYGFSGTPNFTNNGTLWVTSVGAQVLSAFNIGIVTNNGVAVAQSTGGDATVFQFSSTSRGLNNSGSIFALAHGGTATGEIDYSGSGNVVSNSGTIAAQSDQYATAIRRQNGGEVVNAAGGAILAEGANAVAIRIGRGHFLFENYAGPADIQNAGLIVAASTNPNTASVAILATPIFAVEGFDVVNSGTIRGDYAVYVSADYNGAFDPAGATGTTLTNLAGGRIEGAIVLDLSDDIVVNHGIITGYVDLGEGNDRFDNNDGTLVGVADLGFGNDLFIGGNAGDVVAGGRGNDTIGGGDGNDLLLGGHGDDVLTGGVGNDGLYGEGGNDLIVTAGGDAVFGDAGDDRVVLGDYSFARIDGGVGRDTLVLPGGGRIVDLGAVLASGRVSGFEAIDLQGNKELVVRPGDVAQLTGGGSTLTVSGIASDTVDLVGSWTAGAISMSGGLAYQSYVAAGVTILIQVGVVVSTGQVAPAGATGLDPVAAGAAAPVAGSVPGSALDTDLTIANRFAVNSALTLDANETWRSDGGSAVLIGGIYSTLVNYGTVSSAGTSNGAYGYIGSGRVQNHGVIESTVHLDASALNQEQSSFATYGIDNAGNGNTVSRAIYAPSGATIDNSGRVSAQSDYSVAFGLLSFGLSANNSGAIEARSTYLAAAGIYAHNGGTIVNSGTISAVGGVAAYGVGASTHPLTLTNSGTITASAQPGGTAIGLYFYYSDGTQTVTNTATGTITAAIAIQTSFSVNGGALSLDNAGRIDGRIQLNYDPAGGSGTNDVIYNHGTINGMATLGTGNDLYIGTGGQQSGGVYGEAGNDLLIGGGGADTLDGGSGDDILFGGGGDMLTGGAGRDVFVFSATSATIDTISDFVSGVDRIDLSRLSPTSVGLSSSGGTTTIRVATASGSLTINVRGSIALSDITTTSASFDGTAGADSLVATAGGSILHGLDGNDLLVGSDGADRLDGGAGADILWGGAGDDTYVVESAGDAIYENAGGGFDTVEAASHFVLPDNVERLILFGLNTSGVGNALDNIIIGSAGNDYLNGGLGNDRLVGGGGNDTYIVDAQGDTIVEAAGAGIDYVTATASFYLYGNVENLTLLNGSAAIFGVGNELDNMINGNTNDNLLIAGAGADIVYAQNGADAVFGEAGDDFLYGGFGIDYVVGGDGNDVIYGGGDADALYGGAGDDYINADDPGFGTPAPAPPPGGGVVLALGSDMLAVAVNPQQFVTDILVGGDGNDILVGASGYGDYDLLDGGAGNDTYYVDTPDDLTFEAANGGNDTIRANIVGAGYYLYANTENLILDGNTPFGVGNELDNRLTGNAIGNYLLGGAGNDTLNGKGGNDVLFGEAGADIFVFEHGTGGDVIGDFVAGTDRIDLSAIGLTSFAQVQAALGQNGTDSFINLGGGDFVVLNGVAMTSLHAGDFIFASASGAAALGAAAGSYGPLSGETLALLTVQDPIIADHATGHAGSVPMMSDVSHIMAWGPAF